MQTEIRRNVELWIGYVAGALHEHEYGSKPPRRPISQPSRWAALSDGCGTCLWRVLTRQRRRLSQLSLWSHGRWILDCAGYSTRLWSESTEPPVGG